MIITVNVYMYLVNLFWIKYVTFTDALILEQMEGPFYKSKCRKDKINQTASFWMKINIPINSLGNVTYVVLCLKYNTTEDAK